LFPSQLIDALFCLLAPSAPKELMLTPLINNPTQLIATWLEPDVTNGIIEYILYCNTISSSSFPFTLTSQSTRLDIVNLNPYTNYTCTTRARNNVGFSPFSNAAYAQTSQAGKFVIHYCKHSVISVVLSHCLFFAGPSAPSINSSRALSADVVWLNWDVPQQINGILKKYVISYFITSEGHTRKKFLSVPAGNLEANITGLKPFTSYTFRVRATTVEDGPDSNSVTISTQEGRT